MLDSPSPLTKDAPVAWDVFDFETFEALLAALKGTPPKRRRPYSLAELADKTGYSSPRLLGMVINGQRVPSSRLVGSLATWLAWDRPRREYVDALVAASRERIKKPGSAAALAAKARVESLRKYRTKPFVLDEATERILSRWYYLPLKQLVDAPGFREDGAWLAKHLRGRVPGAELLAGLASLESLGILERDAKGGLRVSKSRQRVITQPDRVSLLSRRNQVEMMQRAVEALTEAKPEEREFSALTLRMSPSRLAEAKRELRSFVEEFSARYFSAESDDVFQFNHQLFRLTADDA